MLRSIYCHISYVGSPRQQFVVLVMLETTKLVSCNDDLSAKTELKSRPRTALRYEYSPMVVLT